MGMLMCTTKILTTKLDERFWENYCNKLYSPEFWHRAILESPALPYISMYHEFQRLKQFEHSQLPKVWKNEDYYSWWNLCKKSKRTLWKTPPSLSNNLMEI
jgi:hypothetical protein